MPSTQQLEHPGTAPAPVIHDHGGRRRNPDRRRYTSRSYFPERRATRFRRSEDDRRKRRQYPSAVSHERRIGAQLSFRIVA